MGRTPYQTTYHCDGSVTIWDIYVQQWDRTRRPSDRVLASLDWRERAQVLKHCGMTYADTFARPARPVR
jgi:hypothetical protein